LEQLRIIVVDMPRLVRDLIERAIVAQPDMKLLGVLDSPREMVAAARVGRPDFVVVGLKDKLLPHECQQLLAEHPAVRLLGVEAVAGEAHLYELRPYREALGEVSPADIVSAIRGAARRLPLAIDGIGP
jgi:DNA-binding NarL/FixJ family response regulator